MLRLSESIVHGLEMKRALSGSASEDKVVWPEMMITGSKG